MPLSQDTRRVQSAASTCVQSTVPLSIEPVHAADPPSDPPVEADPPSDPPVEDDDEHAATDTRTINQCDRVKSPGTEEYALIHVLKDRGLVDFDCTSDPNLGCEYIATPTDAGYARLREFGIEV
jgi:hypothetical protein